MRPRFRESLEMYGEIAKDMKGSQDTKTDQELISVLRWNMEKNAGRRETSEETQMRIFTLQQKKQEIMAWLKGELKKLDDPAAKREQPKGSVKVAGEEGNLYFMRPAPGGQKKEWLSLGDLLTDGDWDMQYYLDPESVPRSVQKEFLLATAKRKLQDYLDRQIFEEEIGSKQTHEWRRDAYKALREAHQASEQRGGHLFEKLVRNFLTKLTVDHGLDFEVEQADAHLDVEHKIDLILRRKQHLRGVGVKEGEEDIGIQLTQNVDPNVLRHKERQIRESRRRGDAREEDIADIILIAVPGWVAQDAVAAWKRAGRPPGGPDRFLSAQHQERLFRVIMQGFLGQKEIDEQWAKVAK